MIIFLLLGLFIGVFFLQEMFKETKPNCRDRKEIHVWEIKEGKHVCTKCDHVWGED